MLLPLRLLIDWVRGTEAGAQTAQTASVAAKEVFTGTEAQSQAAQVVAAAARETFTGTESASQAAQTAAVAALEIFSGSEAGAQGGQTASAASVLAFVGSEDGSQASQTGTASGALGFQGSADGAQDAQSATGSGALQFVGSEAAAQAAQQADVSGSVTQSGVVGTCDSVQLHQSASGSGTTAGGTGQHGFGGGVGGGLIVPVNYPFHAYEPPPAISGTVCGRQWNDGNAAASLAFTAKAKAKQRKQKTKSKARLEVACRVLSHQAGQDTSAVAAVSFQANGAVNQSASASEALGLFTHSAVARSRQLQAATSTGRVQFAGRGDTSQADRAAIGGVLAMSATAGGIQRRQRQEVSAEHIDTELLAAMIVAVSA